MLKLPLTFVAPLSKTLLTLSCVCALACNDAPEPAEGPAATESSASATPAASALREVPVAEASAMFEAGSAAPVDANSASTRESRGTVPGATLLSSGEYALTELPDADLLVFYCSNENCSASDRAAERARDAGREVAVMRDGIAGWIEAGRPVARPGA